VKKRWYAMAVRAGQEEKIKDKIGSDTKRRRLSRLVGRVLVPTEKIRRMRGNSQQWYIDTQNKFAGYIFVELVPHPDSHHLLHDINGVFNLLPTSEDPHPLLDHEVAMLLAEYKEVRSNTKADRIIIPYSIGEMVRITHGSFKGMNGTVTDIYEDKPGDDPKVKVEILVLNQPTHIDLKFFEVALA
jgi:transcriptional antiterminator NusG